MVGFEQLKIFHVLVVGQHVKETMRQDGNFFVLTDPTDRRPLTVCRFRFLIVSVENQGWKPADLKRCKYAQLRSLD